MSSNNVNLNNVIKPPVKLPKVNTTPNASAKKALNASKKVLRELNKNVDINTKNKNQSVKDAVVESDTKIKKVLKNASKHVNVAVNEAKKASDKSVNAVVNVNKKLNKAVKNINSKINKAKNNPTNSNVEAVVTSNKNLVQLNKELTNAVNNAKSIENDVKKVNENLSKANLKINYLNKMYRANGTIMNVLTNNSGGKFYITNNKKKQYVTFENNRPKTELLQNGLPKGNKKINGVLHYNVNGKSREVFEDHRGIRYTRRPGPKGNGKHYPFGTAKFFNNKQIMNNLLL